MHTTDELDGLDFEYRYDGRVVARDEVLPPIALDDRVGVVMADGSDGLGAGNFILSCVTAFYDRLRETHGEFFEYPDYYTFQIATEPANYGMLDIYPEHKNITVAADAEALLRAINDRAITILLVPAGPTKPPEVDEITRRSAERRIDHCFLYAPDGQPPHGDISIQLPRQPTEDWYETVTHSVESGPEIDSLPASETSDSHIAQRFRELSFEQALSHLPHR